MERLIGVAVIDSMINVAGHRHHTGHVGSCGDSWVMSMRNLAFGLIAAAMFVPSHAHGAITLAPVADEYRVMIVRGDFDHDQDLGPIFAQISNFGPDAITFDSPGGNVYAAMELGRFLRTKGVATVQTRAMECASACSLAFIGGSVRFADPGSIGVHQSSFSIDGIAAEQVSAIQGVTADVLSYLREMGVDSGLLETALRYQSHDIRYLSASEMDEFGVTTSSMSVASSMPVPPSEPKPRPPAPQPKSQDTVGIVLHPGQLVDVRSAPSNTAQSLGVISNGTRVGVMELTDNWYRISTQGGSGYVPAAAVKIDGFYDAGSGRQFIQVLSLRSQGALDDYLETTGEVDVYESVTGWFAITLKGSFPEAEAKAILERLKSQGSIPGDAFATYGNTYRSKICCDRSLR